MTAAESSRDELLDALRAALEAIAIPHAATVGDGEIRTEILLERVMHARTMLESVLREDSPAPVPWSVEYLRERLAEHPAAGYRTWDERVAELYAEREAARRPDQRASALARRMTRKNGGAR